MTIKVRYKLFGKLLLIGMVLCIALNAESVFAAKLINKAGKGTVIVICINKKGAEDYTDYAENIIKEQFKHIGFAIMNLEMFEKVKKDRMLFEAIRNADSDAMAKVSTDYGADILVRAYISVESAEKFAGSWEGLSLISLKAIDTRTAEEIETVVSDPMGSVENPSAMADSSLSSKQMAIRQAVDNLFMKMGVSTDTLTPLTTICPKFYTAFASDGGTVRSIIFSRDGKLLAAAVDGTVMVWNTDEKKLVKKWDVASGKITQLSLDKTGKIIAAVTTTGMLYTWRWPNGEFLKETEAHSRGAWSVDISPDSTIIATGGSNQIACLWDLSTLMKIGEFRGHADKIHSTYFDAKGKYIITASDDLTIRQWDIGTKKEIRAFADPMDKLVTAALNLDRSMIVYGVKTIDIDLLKNRRADKRYIRLRDMVSGQDVFTFEGHTKDILSVAFFPGKRFVVSAAEDGLVKIWDTQKRGEVSSLEQEDKATCVGTSPDGRWLGIGNVKGTVILWAMK